MSLPIRSNGNFGSKTATAGTAITRMIPPRGKSTDKKLRGILTTFSYTSLGTAHTISLIREFANTPVFSAAVGGQKVVVLTVDPGLFPKGPNAQTSLVAAAATAAGDFLVFETPDGAFYFDMVASVATGASPGTLSVTMTNNLPTGGIAQNAIAWLLKAPGGNDVWTGLVNEQLLPPISATFAYQDIENGIFGAFKPYSPVIVTSNNITAAGTINNMSWVYTTLP
jgi:hypothetical protein